MTRTMTTTILYGIFVVWAAAACLLLQLSMLISIVLVPEGMLTIPGVAAFSMPRQQQQKPSNNRSKKRRTGGSSSSSSSSKFNTGGGGNKNWYEKRKAGVRVASRGPKPPKWEREGDDLYSNINTIKNNGNDEAASNKSSNSNKDMTYGEARKLLRPFEGTVQTTTKMTTLKTRTREMEQNDNDAATDSTAAAPATPPPSKDDKPFLWGELPVGPVWKSRLVAAGYNTPTPIQVASYNALIRKTNTTSVNGNAVIAAATGSGKSLAYLLPFLATVSTNTKKQNKKNNLNRNGNNSKKQQTTKTTTALGKIWIMTPTMELAYQLQRTVDNVIVGGSNDDAKESSSKSGSNVLHVVEYDRAATKSKGGSTSNNESFSVSYPILADIIHKHYSYNDLDEEGDSDDNTNAVHQEPTFLAGTPKLFLQLRKEIKKVLATTSRLQSNVRFAKQRKARQMREAREGIPSSDDDNDNNNDSDDDDTSEQRQQLLYRSVALALKNNLKTLILDEVDRLLQTTTATARREHQTTKPLAQELLEALVWEYKPKASNANTHTPNRRRGGPPRRTSPTTTTTTLQIVCASATIGRALRRQLMYIVKAPSTDKAAILVTADVRTKKDAGLRKASLLPSNLKHSYGLLLQQKGKEENDKGDGNSNSGNGKSSATTSTTTTNAMVEALARTLLNQDQPAPSLVFPGAIGVEAVREYLENAGFRDIRGLSDLRTEKKNVDIASTTDSITTASAPVYVVKERLARGLDLPEIRTVVLMGVPSNAAAYAHLAGRTARQNAHGECVTLCWPREAPKLVSIAETLGLNQWNNCLNGNDDNDNSADHNSDSSDDAKPQSDGKDETTAKQKNDNLKNSNIQDKEEDPIAKQTQTMVTTTSDNDNEWDLSVMTKTAIKTKTVPELRKFLESKDMATKGLLKTALVDAIFSLKISTSE